jgi:hypothetical protein
MAQLVVFTFCVIAYAYAHVLFMLTNVNKYGNIVYIWQIIQSFSIQ